MTETRWKNAGYELMAKELIDTEPKLAYIKNSDVSIIYLSSDNAKNHNGGRILGQCERVQDKYRWAINADFTITLFEPNIEGRTEEIIKRVLYHELLHVGIEKDRKGNVIYSVNPHDCEDFRDCIERWGVNWSVIE